jgi:hypothetical protein
MHGYEHRRNMARLHRPNFYWKLIDLTSQFRFKVSWAGARKLLADRGTDPQQIIMLGCDKGDDVSVDLVLPGGKFIRCDFQEDPKTRQKGAIFSWEELEWDPVEDLEEIALAVEVSNSPYLCECFDRAVLAYFDFHYRQTDKELPPKIPVRGSSLSGDRSEQ